MNNEHEQEQKPKEKSLYELEQENIRKLEQFIVITWRPNPKTGKVTIWIDDGTFKMVMSNEKFISILENILIDSPSKQTYYNLKNIENSLGQYQGYYQYNRQTDEYKALHQLRFNDKLSMKDVYDNSRAEYNSKFGINSELSKFTGMEIYSKIANQDIKKNQNKKNYLQNVVHYYGSF